MNLIEIAKSFKVTGEVLSVTPYGMGHINDTYLVVAEKRYILQRINSNLFTDPAALIHNIFLVSKHLSKKISEEEILTLIENNNGTCLLNDNGNYYRMYAFIEDTDCYQIADLELFKRSGEAFGRFTSLLDDFDASALTDILPAFHDARIRLKDFKNAVQEDNCDLVNTCQKEIDFVLKRESYASVYMDLLESNQIPYRVTHNDTKLNNVLFFRNNNGGAIIDMDTIMKGAAGFDFGDSIRFGASTAQEDEKDLSKVHFSLDHFKAYTEGYLSYMGSYLNQKEVDSLAFSAILLTYECGVRFLTDYLQGSTYFKIAYPEHNLIRARTQFKLIEEMEEKLKQMNEIVLRAKRD